MRKLLLILTLLTLLGESCNAPGMPQMNGGEPPAPAFGGPNPVLAYFAGKAGMSGSTSTTTGNNFQFQMEASSWPRAVTAGETIVMMGSWPDSAGSPTFSDDKSNPWATVFSSVCKDSSSIDHGFFYAVNVAANTATITETHSAAITNTVMDMAHFYNMSTASSGFVDGKSCLTGVTPGNNTPPNISGTAYTTTASNDLILTCVFDENTNLGPANPRISIKFPSGSGGLNEEPSFGHACAYQVQSTAGSFTPTFTVAQSTHDSFTIISVALKPGSGGTGPSSSAIGPLIAEQVFLQGSGQTQIMNLPCPSGTTNILVRNDAGDLTGVSDSSSNSYTVVTVGSLSPSPTIAYVNNPTVTGNTFAVSLTYSNGGDNNLTQLQCNVNTTGVDMGFAAANSSTVDGTSSGITYNSQQETSTIVTDAPSGTPSVSGDMFFQVLNVGIGPFTSCNSAPCVSDYVTATWTGNGDAQAYSNGDAMAHGWEDSTSAVDFSFNIVNSSSFWQAMMLALQ